MDPDLRNYSYILNREINKMKTIITVIFLIFIFTGYSCQHTNREIISSPNAPKAIGPYSQAVLIGDRIYLSGQLGLNPETGKFAGQDFEAQVRQALENQKAILETAGFSLKDVVQCQVFVTDMDNYPMFNTIYKEFF